MASKRLLILFLVLFPAARLMATHQRAAEITYKWVHGLTYEITVTMYTYTPSPADDSRITLPILWGDNSSSDIPRIQFDPLPDNYTLNVYRMEHTFSGSGTYTISVEDPNRNFGVVNIPNSVNVPMYVESQLVINSFLAPNNSVQLLNSPIDQGCVNRLFVHNASAFDLDGDSLSFKLVNCRGAQGLEIPGYTLPLASTDFTIDPVSGDLVWNTPVLQGEYNVAFRVEEWRQGIFMGAVVRDMQILIGACNNNPPIISLDNSHCVIAGQSLNFDVTATDPDNNKVTLTASGAPLEVQGAATVSPNPATGTPTATASFNWNTDCRHIQKAPYSLLFKAKDNHPEVSLTSFAVTNIKVVGPPVENLLAQALGNGINLTWSYPNCQNILSFRVYRKTGTSSFVPGECESGIPASSGFEFLAQTNGPSTMSFRDDNQNNGLSPGITYCYIVIALFEGETEGMACLPACASLRRDLPVMTHVSNDSLNLMTGKVLLAWAPPSELDENQHPGPYRYEVYRNAPGQTTLIYTGFGLNDTLCRDETLNLNETPTNAIYQVRLLNNDGEIGRSRQASSVKLTATPSDRSIALRWAADVPWANYTTQVFRKNDTQFTLIGNSTTNSFTDFHLINGQQYTYYIMTIGKFDGDGFVQPIHNFSPIVSAIPVDNVPPCPPSVSVETNCTDISNILHIVHPADSCFSDASTLMIYFSPGSRTNFSLLTGIPATETQYLHQGLENVLGCYYVKAADAAGNISEASETICIDWDTCPAYELPNVFTPNGDHINDTFIPFGYPSSNPKSNIDHVDFHVINRWGNIVFKTNDPLINWDGKDIRSGIDCAEGTYFYVCKVIIPSLDGLREQRLQGSITIIR